MSEGKRRGIKSPNGRIEINTCRACHCLNNVCRCGREEHQHYKLDGQEAYLCPALSNELSDADWVEFQSALSPRPWRYDRRHGWVTT